MQREDVLLGEEQGTYPNRFYGKEECDAVVLMSSNHVIWKPFLGLVRDGFGFNGVDVMSSAQLISNITRGGSTILAGLKLAIEKHLVRRVFICRHQGLDEHKIFKPQAQRKDEDRERIAGLLKAKQHILELHPGVEVTAIYTRFPNNGKQIQFTEVLPDRTEVVRLLAENRFMSSDGREKPCEATIITCMDFRQFREVRSCVRDAFGLDLLGVIGMPGSSKRFLEDGRVSWASFDRAVEQHRSNKFFIFHHSDCGAYGGSNFFNGDLDAEERFHRKEMRRLKALILKRKPGVEVELIYARFIENGKHIRFVKFV